jgi:hypothetical protein
MNVGALAGGLPSATSAARDKIELNELAMIDGAARTPSPRAKVSLVFESSETLSLDFHVEDSRESSRRQPSRSA